MLATMADSVELTDLRQVTHGHSRHEHPVFSPDGARIAYYAGTFGYLQIFVAGQDGRDERPLTCERGNHTQPSWSPDGRWIFYRRQESPEAPWQLWRVDVADPGRKQKLLAHRKTSFKHPSPSPDGRTLAWFSDEGSPGNFHLFTAPLSGDGKLGRRRQLTGDRNRNDCHPTWSPDGTRLAFHAYMGRDEASVSHIFVCDRDGGGARPLTDAPAMHKHPFFVGMDAVVHHTEEADGRRYLSLRRARDGELIAKLTGGRKNDKHPSPWVPARGPARLCFASRKRGPEGDDEDPTYDIFWGVIEGLTVKRPRPSRRA
jgi:dipeptidyl aminopeptidase/acylaminoacyl peptidase